MNDNEGIFIEDDIKQGDWVCYYNCSDALQIAKVEYVIHGTEDPICTNEGRISANMILEVRHHA